MSCCWKLARTILANQWRLSPPTQKAASAAVRLPVIRSFDAFAGIRLIYLYFPMER